MRVVFDTNALVSAALLSRSVSRLAFNRVLESGVLLTSSPCLAELNDVLHRRKFSRYLTPFEADLFINQYSLTATVVEVTTTVRDCRDDRDNKFLEVAIDGRADCIVSGDEDLLILDPYRGIFILNPGSFLSWIEK